MRLIIFAIPGWPDAKNIATTISCDRSGGVKGHGCKGRTIPSSEVVVL